MDSEGKVVSSSSIAGNKLGGIFLVLTKNGKILKKIDYDGKPLSLDVKSNGGFNKIYVELFTCSAMKQSRLRTSCEKVNTFAKYDRINFLTYFNGEDKVHSYSMWIDFSVDDDDDDEINWEDDLAINFDVQTCHPGEGLNRVIVQLDKFDDEEEENDDVSP